MKNLINAPLAQPFGIGAVDCWSVSAGSEHFRTAAFFSNAPKDTLRAALERYHITTERIETAMSPLLLRVAGRYVLIDCGMGAEQMQDEHDPLIESLASIGVRPDMIDTIVLSHAHTDHMGGAFLFPKARVIMSRLEWEYWHNPQIPQEQRDRLRELYNRVDLVSADAPLFEGVTLLHMRGHTPGHVAVKIESRGEKLFYGGDTLAHPLHAEHLDWNIVSDVEAGLVRESRRALLEQAAREQWLLYMYHQPVPALFTVTHHGDAYQLAAAEDIR